MLQFSLSACRNEKLPISPCALRPIIALVSQFADLSAVAALRYAAPPDSLLPDYRLVTRRFFPLPPGNRVVFRLF
jgi:hypothetical protein